MARRRLRDWSERLAAPTAAGAWALLSVVVALVLGAGRTLMAARLIGAQAMGVMGAALLVLGALDALTAAGVETYLVSRRGRVEADLDAAFTLQLLRGVVMAVALLALAPAVARFFAAPEVIPVTLAVAAVPLLRGFANPAVALLVRQVDFRRLFWLRLPESAIAFVATVGLAAWRRDVWALVGGTVAAQLAATVLSFVAHPYRPRLRFRGRGARRLLHHARWMQGTGMLMFLSLHVDNLAVGRFLGTAALGLYEVAFRIAEIPWITFTRAASQVGLPLLARERRNPERLKRRYAQVLAAVTAANLAFAVVVLLLGGPLVQGLLGPSWRPVVGTLPILAAAMVFRSVMSVVGQLFYALGRPQRTLRIHAVRLLMTLSLLYPLLDLAGMEGVAAAVLLAHVVAACVALDQARRALRALPGASSPGTGTVAP